MFGAVAALAGAGSALADSPPSLSVSPPFVVLDGAAPATLTVTNTGTEATTIAVTTGNYVVRADGSVQVDPPLTPGRSARNWLRVSPANLPLAAGASGTVSVNAVPARAAAPGDHQALVLLTSAGATGGQVAIQARVGVNVLVRVGGPLVRRLAVARLRVVTLKPPRRTPTSATPRVRRRVLRIRIANQGNLAERLLRRQVVVYLRRGRAKHVVATLLAKSTVILPGLGVTFDLPYSPRLKGLFRATLVVRPASQVAAGPGSPVLRRTKRTVSVRL